MQTHTGEKSENAKSNPNWANVPLNTVHCCTAQPNIPNNLLPFIENSWKPEQKLNSEACEKAKKEFQWIGALLGPGLH